MFAIVNIANRQCQVAPGEILTVAKLAGSEGDLLEFDQVLLLNDGKKTVIGTPTVKGLTVKAKIVSQYKGEKIEVRRYKSKVRYRKTRGFRPQLTKLAIVSVG